VRTIEAVVWDMDGTLFDSSEVVPAAYSDAVVAAGLPPVESSIVVAAYPLGAPAVLLGSLLGGGLASESDLAAYHASLARRAIALAVYAGMLEALDALKGAVVMAVFTGGSTQGADVLLSAAGIRDRFEVVVGGDQVVNPKPAPDGLLLACQQLGVPAKATAYVGDSALDLRCARNAGSIAVAAGWGHQYDPDEPCDLRATSPNNVLSLVFNSDSDDEESLST
jgi:HAD superfamily hydrolase (TIGR01509 family)